MRIKFYASVRCGSPQNYWRRICEKKYLISLQWVGSPAWVIPCLVPATSRIGSEPMWPRIGQGMDKGWKDGIFSNILQITTFAPAGCRDALKRSNSFILAQPDGAYRGRSYFYGQSGVLNTAATVVHLTVVWPQRYVAAGEWCTHTVTHISSTEEVCGNININDCKLHPG